MRILFILHRFYPDFVGGTEQHALDLAQGLIDQGHQVAIFYRAPGTPALITDTWGGVPVYRARAGPMDTVRVFGATFGSPSLLRMFREALERFRPDLVHIHHLMGLPAGLVRIIRQRKIPYLVSLHDYWWICANAMLWTNDTSRLCDGPDRLFLNCARCGLARLGWPVSATLSFISAPIMALRARMLRHALQGAARVIAFSAFVRDQYLRYNLSDRLIVVRCGIDRPEAVNQDRPQRESVRFLYLGGIAAHKGLHCLIQAFHRVGGNAELWIGGDWDKDPSYAQYILKMTDHPGIRFLGRVEHAESWRLLAESDAVVVPSLCHETFSMLAHEALAAGTPVIASALGALPEAIQDGVNGILVSPGDVDAWAAALEKVATDSVLRKRLREGIQPERSFDEYVREMESIYQALL